VDSLQSITEEQWQQLKLPMALVTAIKKKLAAALTKDVEMADTSPKPQQ